MKKLPKFITRLISISVEHTIQVCYDISLKEKNISISYTSDDYKDGLYNYTCKVRDELKKVEDFD